jgi:hypothetical protein
MALAFWAMPVTATVVADMDLPAIGIIALINMITQCLGAAVGDSV